MNWKSCGKSPTGSDLTLFKLDDQEGVTERIALPAGNAWLLVKIENNLHIDFAVFEFHHSEIDGTDAHYSMVFHGSGPAGSLRECRHIWWGDPDPEVAEMRGYTFFLHFAVVENAFAQLRRWFDG